MITYVFQIITSFNNLKTKESRLHTKKESILEKEISKNKYLRNRVIGNKKARTNVYKILFSFHFQVDNE